MSIEDQSFNFALLEAIPWGLFDVDYSQLVPPGFDVFNPAAVETFDAQELDALLSSSNASSDISESGSPAPVVAVEPVKIEKQDLQVLHTPPTLPFKRGVGRPKKATLLMESQRIQIDSMRVPEEKEVLPPATALQRKRAYSRTSQVVPGKSKRARAMELMMKRDSHNDSERTRRSEMKDGLMALKAALPQQEGLSRLNTGQLLDLAIAYIAEVEAEEKRLLEEKDALLTEHRRLANE